MIGTVLLAAFFLTLAMDSVLDIGLVAAVGLSAKNGFLYLLLLIIVWRKVLDRHAHGVQFPGLHAAFLVLVGHSLLSIVFMHFVAGDTAGYGLFGHVALLKSHLLDLYLLFIVFLHAVPGRDAAIAVARFLLVVISLVALLTLADVLNVPDLGLVGDGAYGRLEGPLGGPNAYGIFLAVFIPVLTLAAMGSTGRLLRVTAMAGAAAAMALLLQTGSRGGMLGLLVAVPVAAWWLRGGYDSGRAVKAGLTVAVCVVALLAVVLAVSADVSAILEQRLQRSTAGNLDEISAGRLWIWGQGLDYLLARPWTLLAGAGWGAFWTRIGMGPHSVYMNLLFSLGVPGLAVFLALILGVLLTARRAFLSPAATGEERLLLGGLVMGWLVLIVSLGTSTSVKIWPFIWPYTGLCLRLAHCLLTDTRDTAETAPATAYPGVTESARPLGGVGT